MNGKRAREILKKLDRSYRVRLGLARHYSGPYGHLQSTKDKQQEKVEKYTDIVDALDFAMGAIDELEQGKCR